MSIPGTRSIASREQFLVFLEALIQSIDLQPEAWENGTLKAYIQAMRSWVEDMDGFYKNTAAPGEVDLSSVNWRVFADILMAARMYE